MTRQLTDRPYNHRQLLWKYIDYQYHATGGHGIHSPYLYRLYREVICGRQTTAALEEALAYRARLRCDTSEIRCVTSCETDSGSSENCVRRISDLVRKESCKVKTGKLLFRLVSHLQAVNVLELGTNLGVGTRFLAAGMQGGQLFTIEKSRAFLDVAHRDSDLPHGGNRPEISWVQERFGEVLPEVLAGIPSLDFVYFDGHHRYLPTLEYFGLCLEKANNRSVFAFDDIHWSAGMEKAWKEIAGHPRVSLSVDLFRTGLVFFSKELSRQHMVLRF